MTNSESLRREISAASHLRPTRSEAAAWTLAEVIALEYWLLSWRSFMEGTLPPVKWSAITPPAALAPAAARCRRASNVATSASVVSSIAFAAAGLAGVHDLSIAWGIAMLVGVPIAYETATGGWRFLTGAIRCAVRQESK